MFDGGVPAEQLHQFTIASSRTPLSSIPLPFPLHHGSSISPPPPPIHSFPSFDAAYPSHHHHQSLSSFLHHHQTAPQANKDEENSAATAIQRERSTNSSQQIDTWSNDEVLALLRFRSSTDNWFLDVTWEHVSRKLAELGFIRSAEKCKEKFEEETRNFNIVSYPKSTTNRFFSELEQVCGDQNPPVVSSDDQKNKIAPPKKNEEAAEDKTGWKSEDKVVEKQVDAGNDNPSHETDQQGSENPITNTNSKKRKRKQREEFAMFMGFCENIVKKIMVQQEELHNKLLEDMASRDQEKIAKEEVQRKQEMERMNKEMEMRARDQAVASDRQAAIIEFLNKLASCQNQNQQLGSISSLLAKVQNKTPLTCLTASSSQGTSSTTQSKDETLSPSPSLFGKPGSSIATKMPTLTTLAPKNPKSPDTKNKSSATQNPNLPLEGTGKRWPKDEILALINMRCRLYNGSSSSNDEEKQDGGGGGKVAGGSLWERISQGMGDLGYRRSAKRCKEKWENINKYFRKTKDVNKKRSVDSRTCPYFQQLSILFDQGTLVVPPPGSTSTTTTQQEGCSDSNLHRNVDGESM